jgi:hypothetical protein
VARRCSTICLPFDQALYPDVVADPTAFRQALDRFFRAMPELFPAGFAGGYVLKDRRRSRKLRLCLRRIRLKTTGESFTVRPAFALPYMAGVAGDASGPLFLRGFGVPFWALARVFSGYSPMPRAPACFSCGTMRRTKPSSMIVLGATRLREPKRAKAEGPPRGRRPRRRCFGRAPPPSPRRRSWGASSST